MSDAYGKLRRSAEWRNLMTRLALAERADRHAVAAHCAMYDAHTPFDTTGLARYSRHMTEARDFMATATDLSPTIRH